MKSNILLRPVVTEKSMKDAAVNRYTFAVTKEANKAQILAEITKAFSVTPLSVKTITVKGKTSLSRKTREVSRKTDWKKAIVELPKEQKIDLFDTAGQEVSHA
ncbi:50S ribosomal protein L23 [Patescibacteria group bacterium]|nr:50S ribosomal protein L23 [Patescibacteria group bacterium]